MHNTVDEKQKLFAIFALCEERTSLPTDTLRFYAQTARQLADKKGSKKEIVLADYYMANVLSKKGLIDSSLQLINKHYALVEQWNAEPDLQNKYSFQKGQLLIRFGLHKEAMELYYKALARGEKNHDTLAQIISRNSIGWTYMELDQHHEAINWFHKAINTSSNKAYFEKYSLMFSNLAATYNTIGKNDSAEYFIKEALHYARLQQNLQSIANSLAIQADIFIDTKRNSLAEASLNEAVETRKQVGDPFYIVSDITQLAIYYAHNGQPEKGIALCNEGIKMATEFNIPSKLSILYNALAENYKASKNYEMYGATLSKLIRVKDSLYKTASAEALANLQARYDVQKKENIIIQQKLALAEKNVALVEKNYWLYGSIIFSVLILTSLFLLFKSYRRKQKLKLRLMHEEERRNSKEAVIVAEEAERKRIAADLHDSLGAYAASIASNIQQLEQSVGSRDAGVLNELRTNAQAIVSQLSDTIWVLKKDALLLTSISDRLKVFIQKLGPSYPYVTIDVWEEIKTDYLLPPAQAFHLFQIIKEAINNALKHSSCTEIMVRIEAGEGWKVNITDNGKGMKETLLADGNGLANMKERSKESGWNIQWRTNRPKGTSVIIEPTTN